MMRAGAVVVTYNSAAVIGDCLEACIRLGLETVVVDNASSDNTQHAVRTFPQVRLIPNESNRGFAAAVNQGIRALETEVVLILNPDAAPVSGLEKLFEEAADATVGAAGGRLVDRDNATQHGFNVRAFPTPWTLAFEVLGLNRLWPGNPVNRRYRQRLADTHPVDADQPAGAFLAVNKRAWQQLCGLDEEFWPIWFEDVDFCLRLKQAGYRVRYVPEALAHHVGGHSALQVRWEDRQVFWYGNLLRYAAKHFDTSQLALVAAAVTAAAVPRMMYGLIVRRNLRGVAVYSKVCRLAWVSIRRGDQEVSCRSKKESR